LTHRDGTHESRRARDNNQSLSRPRCKAACLLQPERSAPAATPSRRRLTGFSMQAVFPWPSEYSGIAPTVPKRHDPRTLRWALEVDLLNVGPGHILGAPTALSESSSRRGREVLSQDARMSGDDAQECEGGTFGSTATLLPVAKGVNADPQRPRELLLRHADETPERADIVTAGDLSASDSFPQPSGNGTREIVVAQFTSIFSHVCLANMPRIDTARKQLGCFLKGQLMLDPVGTVLRRIPFELRITLHNIRQRLSQSMADLRRGARKPSRRVVIDQPADCGSPRQANTRLSSKCGCLGSDFAGGRLSLMLTMPCQR
jgi:hypothetical protein